MKTKGLVWFLSGMICFVGSSLTRLTHAADFQSLDEAVPADGYAEQYAPLFDFDGDGCLPSAGISRDGEQNPGLDNQGTGDEGDGCRMDNFLETSNTLHRYACIVKYGLEYCGDFYALYFKKDQCHWIVPPSECGHRHDWECVVVWTTDGEITDVCRSAHEHCDPVEASSAPFDGDRVMIVYHQEDPTTHAFRFANESDIQNPENPYGQFVTPPIASWYELTGNELPNREMRALLNAYDYGTASIPVRDAYDQVLRNLNKWKPSSYPVFTQASIEASSSETNLEKRVEDLEADMEELRNHSHEYLTGQGAGHNSSPANTGPPIP